MNFLDNYGLYNQSGLTPLQTPEWQLEMEPSRRRPDDGLLPTYPTDFSVPDLDTLLASVDPTAAPTGINPTAPPESQPPAVGTPPIAPTVISTSGPEPNKYERMEGVTLNDRLQSLAMTMSAVGTPQFADVYAKANHLLALKQANADAHNKALDEATRDTYKATADGVWTIPATMKRNPDNTYSPTSSSTPTFKPNIDDGLSSLTPEQRALIDRATGDNADTMLGFFLGQNANIIPKDMTYDEFVVSELNANQGETSKSFNRNAGIFAEQGYTSGQSRALAMLAENGGYEIVRNADTGEIKAIDPVTKESFIIEDYQTGLQKLVQATGAKQDAKNRSDLDRERVTNITTKLDEYDQNLGQIRKSDEVSQYWIDQLEAKDANGQYVIDYEKDFGWLNSLMSDYFGIASPEFSGLSADQIYEALQNLDITNLAPVSNFEFKQVMKLFADGKLASREQALAVLRRAQARADREQGEYQRKYDNELDGLNRLQGDEGQEYLDYLGRKSWITDDEARNRYRRSK